MFSSTNWTELGWFVFSSAWGYWQPKCCSARFKTSNQRKWRAANTYDTQTPIHTSTRRHSKHVPHFDTNQTAPPDFLLSNHDFKITCFFHTLDSLVKVTQTSPQKSSQPVRTSRNVLQVTIWFLHDLLGLKMYRNCYEFALLNTNTKSSLSGRTGPEAEEERGALPAVAAV